MAATLEIEVRPPWPYRMPRRVGGDRVARLRDGVVKRLLHHEGEPVIVVAWQQACGTVVLRAAGAGREAREWALERMRFALGVDEDLRPFYDRFGRDRLVGAALRRRPWLRPARRPLAWEALAWAVTEQLIESPRAAAIQRRIVSRWGLRHAELSDVPDAGAIAALAPAELAALDLSAGRSLALVRCAREVAAGRVDPGSAGDDRRLLAIPEIGPWTVACLGLHGRGEPDSLPAGDLAYVKLVGMLARLGRRATVAEVEEFFEPYEPYRGLAGYFSLVGHSEAVSIARGLPPAPEPAHFA